MNNNDIYNFIMDFEEKKVCFCWDVIYKKSLCKKCFYNSQPKEWYSSDDILDNIWYKKTLK